ncbi:MAG: aldehyde dehydrogenase family protein [Casimicrobiaceae bacterium]
MSGTEPAPGQSGRIRRVGVQCYPRARSIRTRDLDTAHRTAMAVEAGYVWINEVGRHFLGAPFGGVKQSGFGREECLEELLQFTQLKNIHLRLRPGTR